MSNFYISFAAIFISNKAEEIAAIFVCIRSEENFARHTKGVTLLLTNYKMLYWNIGACIMEFNTSSHACIIMVIYLVQNFDHDILQDSEEILVPYFEKNAEDSRSIFIKIF